MTEDQLAVNRNAITLQDNNLDLEAFLPDINWLVLHIFLGQITPDLEHSTGISNPEQPNLVDNTSLAPLISPWPTRAIIN